MTRKLIKYSLYIAFFLLLLTGFAGAGFIAWIVRAPRDISAYTNYIEDSLNGLSPSHKIKIEKAQVSWGGFEEMVKIETKNITISQNNDEVIAIFPQINLDYDALYLLFGELVPSKVHVIGAALDLSKLRIGEKDSDFSLESIERLDALIIENARVIPSNQSDAWKINRLDLKRHWNRVDLDATLGIIGQPTITFSGFLQEKSKGNYEITTETNNITTTYFQNLEPQLKIADVNANIITKISIIDGKPSKLGFNANGIKGKLNEGDIFRASSRIKNGSVLGVYNFIDKKLLLQNLAVEFENGTKITGKGEVRKPQDMTFNLALENLPSADLYKFWPKNLGENAITYTRKAIKKGVITKGTATLNFTPEILANEILPASAIDLKFEYQGLDLNYHEPLLPLSNLNGKAMMDGNSISFDVASGDIGKSKISSTKVRISGIGGNNPENIDIKGGVEGAATDVIDFYEKLARGRKLLRAADVSGGNAKTSATLSFSLKDNLLLDEVNYDIKTKINNALVMNLFDKMSAQNLNADAVIQTNGYSVKGSFVGTANEASKYFYIKNAPLGFAILQRGGIAKIVVNSDLTNSALEIADLNIKKSEGEKASLKLIITQSPIEAILEKVQIDSTSFKVDALGKLYSDFSDITNLDIKRADYGKNSLSASVKKDKGGYLLTINADEFDATKFIEKAKVSGKKKQEEGRDFALKLTARKFYMMNDVTLDNVTIKAICPKSECSRKLNFNSGLVQIDMDGAKVKITSKNAGKFLLALDSYTKMEDGDFLLNATKTGDVYKGNLLIKDFRIRKAGVLTKILTLGSLNGIADTLSGKGISFTKLNADFEYGNDNIKVNKFRMFGNAIGATAEGTIDTGLDHITVNGSIIPAYMANTLLGKIPILGEILIGDKGVFAFGYSVKGKYSDPEVSVNPLSALAPGILKEIFQ